MEEANDVEMDDLQRALQLSMMTQETTVDALGSTSEPVAAGDGSAPPVPVVRSYRCVETGRLFRTQQDVQLYIERTGGRYTQFEESSEEVKPMTKEELEAKKHALKVKIANNRRLKAEAEKERLLAIEKKRRQQGKFQGNMREEGRRMAMKRKAELARKDKIIARKQRERIKQQLEQDKRERAAARAQLGPPAASKAAATSSNMKPAAAAAPSPQKRSASGTPKPKVPPLRRVDAAIRSLLTYDSNGEGLKAIKILRAYVTNALRKDEAGETTKFRRINLGNNAFKTKVSRFQGGKSCLYAAGFTKLEPSDEFPEGCLALESPNEELLQTIKSRLESALTAAGIRFKKMWTIHKDCK